MVIFCSWPGIKQGVINADNVFSSCLSQLVVVGEALEKYLGIGEPLML